MRDAAAKGRLKRNGEANGNSKLTKRLVAKIRAARAKGDTTLRALAAQHGISCSQVFRIVNGGAWA